VGTGPYTLTIQTPAGSFDEMHYYFAFEDAAGNSAASAEKIVWIVDTTLPVLGTDTSDATATAGTTFTFRVNATDNGGIKHVYAVYWTDEGTHQYALLILDNGVYEGSIDVPEGGTLHYYFVAEDMSGNSVQGTQKNIDVTPGEAETPEAELPWLYIIIIVILVVIVLVLLVTRGKGGPAPTNAPEPAPAPAEQPPQETPAPEETEVIR
jgi:hypothetical protein